MSIVTKQGRDGELVRATAERVEQQQQDEAVQRDPDDLTALADEPVGPEELADPFGRRIGPSGPGRRPGHHQGR